jgi:uncharacterized protein with PQ loop repeat
MNSETGYAYSFSGFIDYFISFPQSDVWWFVTGIAMFVGTWLSIYPQYHVLVVERSSFGLDATTLFVMLFAQWLLVANVLCLRAEDLVGLIQYPFTVSLSRFLTFINALSNWFSYLPVVFMHWAYFDLEPRPLRNTEQIKQDMWLTRIFIVLNPVSAAATTIIMFGLGGYFGFASSQVVILGKVYGAIAALLWAAQYLPQMWTTWKLRSPGNLSLLVLAIQAPGGFINSLFMAVGQKDDWTTWVSSLAAAIQQLILLIECLYFKWKNKPLEDMISIDSAALLSESKTAD